MPNYHRLSFHGIHQSFLLLSRGGRCLHAQRAVYQEPFPSYLGRMDASTLVKKNFDLITEKSISFSSCFQWSSRSLVQALVG
jgi:hypothetical protein